MSDKCEQCDSEALDSEAVECDPNYPLCSECWQSELNNYE